MPFILIVVAVIGSFFVKGFVDQNINYKHQVSIPTPIEQSSPTPIPTSTPNEAPVINYIAPTTDPDPIIACNSTYPNCLGQSVQARRSECSNITCCQIGDKWIVYADKNKCTTDQNNYYKSPSNNYISPTYTPSVYIPPIYTPFPTYTYPLPTTTYVAPTPDPQVAIDQHNSQVQQCRSNVASQYAGLIQGCNQYGSSSATDACISIYEGKRQSAYNACGTIY